MKQLFAAVLMVAGLALSQQASAQQLRYYYYPSSNVYYDVANNRYIVPSGSSWVTRSAASSRDMVLGSNRVTVYSETPEVWRYNDTHKAKYKGKSAGAPYGKAVGYKGTNPNKATGTKATKAAKSAGKANASKGKAKGKG
jgi:hypothetical protein